MYPQSAVVPLSQTMPAIQQMRQFQSSGLVMMPFAPMEQFAPMQQVGIQQHPMLQSLPQFPTVQQPATVQYVPVPILQSFGSIQPTSVKESSPEKMLAPAKDSAPANRRQQISKSLNRDEHYQRNGAPNRKLNYQHRRPQRKRAKRSEKKVRSEYSHLQKRSEFLCFFV